MFSKFKLLFFVDVQKYWFIKQIQTTVDCFVLVFFLHNKYFSLQVHV